MKKYFLTSILILISFFILKPVHATDYVDQQKTGTVWYMNWSDGYYTIGQRFVPAHNNISAFDTSGSSTGSCDNSNATFPGTLVICKGVPNVINHADVEANGLTCNWAGVSLVYSGSFTTCSGKEDLPSPVALDVGSDYFWILLQGNSSYHVGLSGGPGVGQVVREVSAGDYQVNYKEYYSDTYTSPPTSSLTINYPQENSIYVGMPANLDFTYVNTGWAFNVARFYIQKNEPWGFSMPMLQYSVGSTTSQTASILINLADGNFTVKGQLFNTLTRASTTPFIVNSFDVSSSTPSGASQLLNTPFQVGTSSVASTSVAFFTTSAHDLACTDEEWATPDPAVSWIVGSATLPFLNITRWKCSIKEVFYSIPQAFVQLGISSMNDSKTLLSNVFPFSISVGFYNSWQASAGASLPSQLSYFDSIIDSSGNVYLPIPSEWVGSATTTPVFGPAVFTSNSSMALFFAGIKALSTYLMWMYFIYAIYNLGVTMWQEINSAPKEGVE